MLLPRLAGFPKLRVLGLKLPLFLWVQKVTLETAVFGLESLERPVGPSAGCCFPVSQGFRSSACWAWNYLCLWVQKVTLETAVSGLEGLEGPVDPSAGCCFPVSQGFLCSACYKLETTLFLWVQKVTLETPVSSLEGPEGAVDPSAGCCFPVSQGLGSSACWAWHYPFSMGSESDVRDCGLWPGRTGMTGGSFSWVLLPRFAGFPKLRLLGLTLLFFYGFRKSR